MDLKTRNIKNVIASARDTGVPLSKREGEYGRTGREKGGEDWAERSVF
jgi:hypothetical protein